MRFAPDAFMGVRHSSTQFPRAQRRMRELCRQVHTCDIVRMPARTVDAMVDNQA
ncbi:hypothetical protein [Streptomyces sp. NPDC058092]|uniref:hypothetical protein n=1 Tax=Streptomyces sp. NPDC058092 TaxID=3346336 RepID=UPI0036EC3186